jgi:hypothetical protein
MTVIKEVPARDSALERSSKLPGRIDALLWTLLAVCIVRLWLAPLGSSFWVDEMVTVFVVRHGAAHPSLAAAPQVGRSVYYFLPKAAEALLGFSEISYRVPSILAMGAAVFLISRLAARLIHPQAQWFAAFACLALPGLNYEAADARPYALGICAASASFFFLVRWLDFARRRDAFLFTLFAGLLWRVHLIFWPLYLVFGLYLFLRIARRQTSVRWIEAAGAGCALALILAPVLLDALSLLREARAHVIALVPAPRDLWASLKPALVLSCGAAAWALTAIRPLHPVLLPRAEECGHGAASRPDHPGRSTNAPPCCSSLALILGWWLCSPLCLFAYSRWTGVSVFVPRYVSVSLPGAALAAAAAAAVWVPDQSWKRAALFLSIGALLFAGKWRHPWPPHDDSDWRSAARSIVQLGIGPETPVLCPSPFIEARPPAWRPGYPLPGFLYAHLPVYPIPGRIYLLPFESRPETEPFAAKLAQETLAAAPRFLLYGSARNVNSWRDWLRRRPAFSRWRIRELGRFGSVAALVFEKPGSSAGAP